MENDNQIKKEDFIRKKNDHIQLENQMTIWNS